MFYIWVNRQLKNINPYVYCKDRKSEIVFQHIWLSWNPRRHCCCLSQDFYCCNKTTQPKSIWWRKCSFDLKACSLLSCGVSEGNQGMSPQAGTDAEALEEFCLLACLPLLAQLAFLITPRNSSLGVSLPTVRWVFSHQLLINEMAPLDCPWVSLVGEFSQLRFSLPLWL